MAADIIVETKLAPEKHRANLFPRDTLVQRLRAGRRKLATLISGPGGFGKSALATLWRRDLIAQGHDVAWYSISADDELRQFVVYFAAAIEKASGGLGREAITLFNRDKGDSTDQFVAAMVNDLCNSRHDIYLILDDYQKVKSQGIHDFINHFLTLAPDNFHLVLISRSTPPLALARLRAHDQLTEINHAELRLSFEEATAFIQRQELNVDGRTIRAAYELSDGWITGMQLIGMALKKYAGIDRDMSKQLIRVAQYSDYLNAEVLSFLSEEAVALLVKISACRLFNADLASHIADTAQAAAVFAELKAENMFLVPADHEDSGQWYRLPSLVAALLRERLAQLPEPEIRRINHRACDWFVGQGHISEAVRHAIYAKEPALAASLLDDCGRELVLKGQLKSLMAWGDAIPAEISEQHTMMQMAISWAELMCGRIEEAGHRVEQLARTRELLDSDQSMELRMLEAMYRYSSDDTAGILEVMPAEDPPTDDPFLIGVSANLRTIAFCHAGRYEDARDVQLRVRRIRGFDTQLLRCLAGECFVGLSFALQGDMNQAEKTYREALAKANCQEGYYSEPACFAASYLSEVLYETGQWDECQRLVTERLDIMDHMAPADGLIRSYVALARMAHAKGHINEAKSYLESLEDLGLRRGLDRLVASALLEHIRLCLSHNKRAEVDEFQRRLNALAASYADASQCVSAEITAYARWGRIRLQLAEGAWQQALDSIVESEAQYRQWGRFQEIARLQLLRAIALLQLGDRTAALAAAADSLTLCQRLGLLHTVLDEGRRATELVTALAKEKDLDPLLQAYIGKMRWDLEKETQSRESRNPSEQPPEKLSARETEILNLLAKALTNKKMALSLGVTPETVKWHLKNIYAKLAVVSRDEAVARGRDFGLID